ncbi:MAG: IPT/TIG domain-containing protein [Terriglobia bacterium]
MRTSEKLISPWRRVACLVAVVPVLAAVAQARPVTPVALQPHFLSMAQAGSQAPAILSIDPSDARPGDKVEITIQGHNFVSGAYVTSSNPAIHVVSTHQDGASKTTVEVQVAPQAALRQVTLYVTNPSGASVLSSLTVSSPVTASANLATAQPSADAAQPASAPGAPVISKVEPASAGPGSTLILTIKGQNFVRGARVAFSNPKLTVSGVNVKSKSELTAQVQIAADAATGSTGLFVVNPDQSEVEGSFEVSGAAINTVPAKPAAGTAPSTAESTSTKSRGKAVSFDVLNLGDVVQILKTRTKVQGTLSVDNGTLTYVENGAKVFSVRTSEVQEVAPNVFFGLNTGTFHVFLSTGKRYNFAAASLNPTDTQKIETDLRQALK